MIEDEGYPDKSLPQDIARGFALVGHALSSSGVLPSKTLAVSELQEHAAMGRSAVRCSRFLLAMRLSMGRRQS